MDYQAAWDYQGTVAAECNGENPGPQPPAGWCTDRRPVCPYNYSTCYRTPFIVVGTSSCIHTWQSGHRECS